jgi:uncharacterized protein (TIGR04255 family)
VYFGRNNYSLNNSVIEDIMTKNIDDICYKKTFLKEVIARIDFLSPIMPIQKELPKAIGQAASKLFPIPEPQTAIDQKVLVNEKGIKTEQSTEYKHWQFFGKDREKFIKITKNFISISHNNYHSYEAFTSEFYSVVDALLDKYKDTQISRIGLRYVNKIELQERNPLDWEDYININLLSPLSHFGNSYSLSKAMQDIELNFDDYLVKFRYGMFNPDFPSPILKKVFVIDIDAYSNHATDINELKTTFDKFHSSIQQLFETNIKEELRRKMNA